MVGLGKNSNHVLSIVFSEAELVIFVFLIFISISECLLYQNYSWI